MVLDYINFWRNIKITPNENIKKFGVDDPLLEAIWVPHTTPGSAQYDLPILDLLHSIDGSRTVGHTRRIDQIINLLSIAELDPNDVVLECFAGPGSITIPLALHCKKVITVEVDSLMAKNLKNQLCNSGIENVEVIVGDITSPLTQDKIQSAASSGITKQVHTPSYYVISETISVCSKYEPGILNIVLPLSLLKPEWGEKDFLHIQKAQEWFGETCSKSIIEVIGITPLIKPNRKASSAVFQIKYDF